MTVSLEQFVQHLTASGLMSATDLSSFQDSLSPEKRPKDAETLARDLVRANKLTKYQAQVVYQGKVKGLVFGDYRVLDKLGQGGMGVVLKAQHQRMDRTVAVKMISGAALKSPDAVKRFYREVKAAAKLNHPNIVQAHDACEHDGVHYLIMEYVEGQDLAAIVRQRGPLPVAQAVDYILQAARGLQYAHKQGIVHRDIKPANLLVDNEGTVKILDMGLARVAGLADEDDKDRLTASGQVMGTLDYMAPEQAMDTHHADARADIYSLGCTLYRLLTGEVLFKCESLAKVIWAHQQAAVPSLCKVRGDVPPQLDAVYQKMVAKKPEDRQQSMAEVIADLGTCGGLGGAGSDAATAAWQSGGGSRNRDVVHEGGVAKPAIRQATAPARDATFSRQSSEEPTTQFMLRLVRTVRNRKVLAVGVVGGLALVLAALIVVRNRGTARGNAPPLAVAPFDAAQAKQHQEAWAKHLGVPVEETNSIGMNLVLIPPGEFEMGSTPEEVARALEDGKKRKAQQGYLNRVPTESPRHHVKITKPYYLGVYQVTQGEYVNVMGVDPSAFTEKQVEAASFKPPLSETEVQYRLDDRKKVVGKDTSRHPVDTVNWDEATEFCRKLSAMPAEQAARRVYRLPTEAEWECACRAGTTTRWYCGDDEAGVVGVAWFYENAGEMTHPVGEKKPNAWGLYDMSGNVFQWCSDWFSADYYKQSPQTDPTGAPTGANRVLRGGRWFDHPSLCRSACRGGHHPTDRDHFPGFRVVAEVEGAAEGGSANAEKAAPVTSPPIPNPQSPIPPPAVAPFDATQAKQQQEAWAKHLEVSVEQTNSIGMRLVLIPPGEFEMGSTPDEIQWALEEGKKYAVDKHYPEHVPTESPRHHVKISKPFYLATYPVTQAEYEKVMGVNPSAFTEKQIDASTFKPPLPEMEVKPRLDDCKKVVGKDTRRNPVETVNWDEAVEFCQTLSAMPAERAARRVYRLPTEAEWEYACRAGTTTRWYCGDDESGLADVAWLGKSAGSGMTHPVGQKRPNAWGLYDMHGNVFQWCSDWFSADYYKQSPLSDPSGQTAGSSHVLRGGSWIFRSPCCRSAYRHSYAPAFRSTYLGFRVVVEIEGAAEGGSAKAEEAVRVTSSPIPNPQSPTPPLAKPAMFAIEAARIQKQWAEHLGVAVEETNSLGMPLVLIPPGEFEMGSTDEEVKWALEQGTKNKEQQWYFDRVPSESPRHHVKITKPFYLAIYQVTQGEYEKVMGVNPSAFADKQMEEAAFKPPLSEPEGKNRLDDRKKVLGKDTSRHPVETVDWDEAVEFCRKLSTIPAERAARRVYRLPTEAEWEYACRAGTTTRWYCGDGEAGVADVAWFIKNSGAMTHPVGEKKPNAWGLYDMSANVYQWCSDRFSADYYKHSPSSDPCGPPADSNRVLRGGNWVFSSSDCRSAARHNHAPAYRSHATGLRVVVGP